MFLSSLALAMAQPMPACEPLPGWQAVAEASKDKFLVLGELHGTEEAPAAVAELLCALSEYHSVLLAIEFGATTDDAFREAWEDLDDGFQERLVYFVEDWKSREDGVASRAMMEMLTRLHSLHQSGRDIDITAFNGAKNETQRIALAPLPGQESHEAAQALNIRAAAERRDHDYVVVLVGNLHAREKEVSVGGNMIRPMAMLLDEPEKVVSLGLAYGAGASWSCQLRPDAQPDEQGRITGDAVECRAFETSGILLDFMEPGFHFFEEGQGSGFYDGYFNVGPITASPPVAQFYADED